jgi:hypothetical protein
LNVLFVNITSITISKYVNISIKKIYNNSLWKSVIYNSNCNDFFIYDLKRFVNKIKFAHKLINISNE